MMKMDNTLIKIQKCQFEMLLEVKRICEKYDIDYFLACGSLLGAVRHKGFIPWDDDLDIFMKNKDLKRFKKVCKKELKQDYFLQDMNSEPTTQWLFTKLRKNGTLMLEPALKNKKNLFHNGVWIDIFPLIAYSNNPKIQKLQVKLLMKLQTFRYWHVKKNYKEKILSVLEYILWFVVDILGYICSENYIIAGNLFSSNFSDERRMKEVYPKLWFETKVMIEFEGELFPCISEFDLYLKQTYGNDYMTPKKYGVHMEENYDSLII